MWSRGMNKTTGKFEVECKDWNGQVFFAGAFETHIEADDAGVDAERRMTLAMTREPVDAATLEMDDEQLLKELLG